jgi:hypothetical protein
LTRTLAGVDPINAAISAVVFPCSARRRTVFKTAGVNTRRGMIHGASTL